MSARLARVLVTTGAAAVALTLVHPAAAVADNGDRGSSEPRGSAQSGGSNRGGAGDDKGDPAGNNGTIKIDYAAPADSGHANRPHPGCAFQLRLFNFDDDQTGTITFVGQAPTALGTLLTQTGKLLSDDAAGGGQDVDSVFSYTAADLGLTTQPQAKQGWHIKVKVDADDAPGGAKQKVFWLKCPVAAAQGTTTQGSTTESTATKTESVTVQGVTEGAATTASTAPSAGVAAQGLTAGETAFTGGSAGAVRGAAAPATTAAGTAGGGTALPFTGVPVLSLVAVALATLVAGGLAIWAGRRRTSSL